LITDDSIEWVYHQLGLLYVVQGKFVEAESIYKRALAGREKVLGIEYTLILDTVHNLGALYIDQGKLVEAESMYE
jgi:tetratricopeptide (TPR) repeat protein